MGASVSGGREPPNHRSSSRSSGTSRTASQYSNGSQAVSVSSVLIGEDRSSDEPSMRGVFSPEQVQSIYAHGLARMDMAFVDRRARDRTASGRLQAFAQPQMQSTETIRNNVNLKKDTLQVVSKSSTDKNMIGVNFVFDAATSCSVHVFYAASKATNEPSGTIKHGVYLSKFDPCTPKTYAKGLNQAFESDDNPCDILDVSKCEDADIYFGPGSTHNAVIILLEALDDNGKRMEQSQTTFATLEKQADGRFGIKVLRQNILVNKRVYELQEIYGLDQSLAGSLPDGGLDAHGQPMHDFGDDCVVCMSERSDTTVLPCRHMCLCHGCAQELRTKSRDCPVCRTKVESLLQIQPSPKKAAIGQGVASLNATE